ncbi:hypothetical protein PACTADRAFT_50658 [Pachysolen tannophilus NRRL Y-2460]|uniref:CinA C-terminal domain-containing protein n=1 Tax=Pachysolen tannophilus NRRL Y-2460 TaxID=669874 RepID=A0A1E4TST3_PACTA|nr:hypothetical protein PACTADRAFT_50658 [Pachysolen tannophilus NRRL Y-2460]
MSFPPDYVLDLVKEISEILIQRNETLSISEAACGGLLSAYLVSIPGASKFFQGGTLVYSLKSRLKLSGWDNKDISNYTGPSEQVVLRLARNLRIELGSTYVLSETGFAGPSITIFDKDQEPSCNDESGEEIKDEQSPGKVGTVYLGISGPRGEVSCIRHTNNDNRAENMQLFAQAGLRFLLDHMKQNQEEEEEEETKKEESNGNGIKKQKI